MSYQTSILLNVFLVLETSSLALGYEKIYITASPPLQRIKVNAIETRRGTLSDK